MTEIRRIFSAAHRAARATSSAWVASGETDGIATSSRSASNKRSAREDTAAFSRTHLRSARRSPVRSILRSAERLAVVIQVTWEYHHASSTEKELTAEPFLPEGERSTQRGAYEN